MTDQTYSQFITHYFAKYKKLGYDLHDVACEESMIMNSPASHFKHGTREQDAILHALALYEADLYEFNPA
tara:strand:+ start:210 stop:419 length:210 start_codon:yes stop_codon:yes gene_type:complete